MITWVYDYIFIKKNIKCMLLIYQIACYQESLSMLKHDKRYILELSIMHSKRSTCGLMVLW